MLRKSGSLTPDDIMEHQVSRIDSNEVRQASGASANRREAGDGTRLQLGSAIRDMTAGVNVTAS